MQKHLTKERTINLGSFYTPKNIIQKAYELLHRMNNYKQQKVNVWQRALYMGIFK
ncbi:hypothetical protein [Helicobacter mesocricetorum]|uniref:hypothetical protein n=1 Tax=Helicobacter mesocricetorum TaxID=87012 RepID=UPI0013158CA4|nr:hypothetical protein [Helicobacter mesocricetorum]